MSSYLAFPLITVSSKGSSNLQAAGTHGGVFVSGNPLSEQQQKFCSCILGATNANNPYAVCAKSTHTSYRQCSEYYDFQNMPMEKLRGYYLLHNITMPSSMDRQTLIEGIRQWKIVSGHSLGPNLDPLPASENSCGCGLKGKTSSNIPPTVSSYSLTSPTKVVPAIGWEQPRSPRSSTISYYPTTSVTPLLPAPVLAPVSTTVLPPYSSKRITSPRTLPSSPLGRTTTVYPPVPLTGTSTIKYGRITSPSRQISYQ